MKSALTIFALMGLLAAGLGAQFYSVTSSAQTYPASMTRGNDLTLGDDDLSQAITPAGFSFDYFGVSYDRFKVGSNGYIIMGDVGSTTSATPDHGAQPGLVIAPFWTDLMPHTGTNASVTWRFENGDLSVEWFNVIQRVSTPTIATHKVMMRVVLETSTGVIRFQYGTPTGTTVTAGALSNEDSTVAISGSLIQSPQPLYIGEIPNYVDSKGHVTTYPEDHEVVFTPVGVGSGPVFTSSPVLHVDATTLYTYTMSASGLPAPVFSTGTLPSWLQLNGNVLEGTPDASLGGTTVGVTTYATNSAGQDSQSFTITIHPYQPSPGVAPTFTSTPVTDAEVGTQYTYTMSATGNPAPTFSSGTLPGWLQVTGDTLHGTPAAIDVGMTTTIELFANNSSGTDSQSFTIDVAPAPEAPAITSTPPSTALVGSSYSYQVVASGHPAPTFTVSGNPAWLSLVGDTLQGTPQAGDVGLTGSITVTATNSEGDDTQAFTIDVNAVPEAPAITSPAPDTATVGETYTYNVTATGNPPPTISFSGLPGWLTQTGGTISGVPGLADVGTSGLITVTAVNSEGTVTQDFTIVVDAASSGQGGGSSDGNGCVAAPGAGLWFLALAAIPLLRRLRGRK